MIGAKKAHSILPALVQERSSALEYFDDEGMNVF